MKHIDNTIIYNGEAQHKKNLLLLSKWKSQSPEDLASYCLVIALSVNFIHDYLNGNKPYSCIAIIINSASSEYP